MLTTRSYARRIRCRLAIVLQPELDRQPVAPGPGELDLFPADVVADDAAIVVPRQVVGELPETSAEFEHGHAGLQVELPGDQVELEALRLVERAIDAVDAVVGACVLHGRAEHRDVQVVREVVVPPRDAS